MAINVLLADHDLDVHKLVADLLPLIFKNVNIDRALKTDDVLERLANPELNYNLIILDLAIGDVDGRSILTTVSEQHPQMIERMVLILDSPDALPDDDNFKALPRVVKPFSLDEFGDTIKKIVAE